MKKLIAIVSISVFLIASPARVEAMEASNIEAQKATSIRNKLLKYFGINVLSNYALLNLLNLQTSTPVSQPRLMSYAAGIPLAVGLGMYLGSIYSNLKIDEEIAQFSTKEPKDIARFLLSYFAASSGAFSAFHYGSGWVSGQPVSLPSACFLGIGHAAIGFSALSSSYLASLLYNEIAHPQEKKSELLNDPQAGSVK